MASRQRATRKQTPLLLRMENKLSKLEGRVVLRDDFREMAGGDQIGRGMRALVSKGRLVRIGKGLYAKATVGPLSGRPVPRGDISSLAREAMNRLGVETVKTRWEEEYEERRTDQIPAGTVVAVKKRVRRRIAWGGKSVEFEVRR
jgi:hypothetical protein